MNWYAIVLGVYIFISFIMLCLAVTGAVHSHGTAGFGSVLFLTFLWPYVFFKVAIGNKAPKADVDHLKLWEKLEKMPGGDQNPFDTPFGPTKMCLSARELVDFVQGGEKTEGSQNVAIWNHLADCKECCDRIEGFKAVR